MLDVCRNHGFMPIRYDIRPEDTGMRGTTGREVRFANSLVDPSRLPRSAATEAKLQVRAEVDQGGKKSQ